MKTTLRLVPTNRGETLHVAADRAMLGRESACDVVVSDGSVSRRHALIERRGNAFYVVDQGSANGTFLNSVRTAEGELQHGQHVRFGSATYRVELVVAGEADTSTEEIPVPTLLKQRGDKPAAASPPSEPVAPLVETQAEVPPVRAPQPPPPPRATASPPAPPPPPPPPRPGAAGVVAARPVLGEPGAEPPPRKGRSPIFWIATGCGGCLTMVLGFVLLLAGAVYVMTQGPADVVRAQLHEIREGKLDAAYARLSDAGRARLTREEFEGLLEAHPALKDNADSSFWQRSVQSDTARLSGTLVSSQGSREAVSYELVHEKGVWRIAAIRFGGE